MPETLAIPARDGFPLAADLFLPAGEPRAAALLAPAMGVPRAFYAAFAGHLAEQGIAALTVDYRGIGGSREGAGTLRGFRAALHDWAELDLAGALDALASRAPGAPLLWIGHSVGGQLFGLLDEARVRAALFVGSQSGRARAAAEALERGVAVAPRRSDRERRPGGRAGRLTPAAAACFLGARCAPRTSR